MRKKIHQRRPKRAAMKHPSMSLIISMDMAALHLATTTTVAVLDATSKVVLVEHRPNYETIELEIKFDYQMELISLASEENRSDAYDELIASTERAMHEVMVDGFLHCGSPGATERHGMDRKRHLTTVAESQPPSPRIVGISSAPQDANISRGFVHILSHHQRCFALLFMQQPRSLWR